MALGRRLGGGHVEVTAKVDEDRMARDVQRSTESAMGRAAKGAGSAVAKGFTALGVLAGGAIALGLNQSFDREVAIDRMNASLGATGPEAERLGAAAGSLYADAFGESMADVTNAVTAVSQNLGTDLGLVDTQEGLEAAAANALNLANVLDEDVSIVAKTAGQLIRNDLADSAEEAFDLIAAGVTNGLNRSDDLLDTFNEYAPAFARLGFDGEQALNAINNGLEAGVFNTDKIGDAFNEFSIRAIDGSDATKEALAQIFNEDDAKAFASEIAAGGEEAFGATMRALFGLSQISDQVEQDAAGVALFGSMWEDLGAEAILSLNPMADGLGEVGGAASELGDTLNDNLSTRIESLKRRGLEALADFTEDHVVPALETFADWAEDNLPDALATAEEWIEDHLVPAIQGLADWVGEYLPRAFDFFRNDVMPVVREVADFITRAFDAIVQWVEANWPQIRDTIVDVVTRIWEVIQVTLDQITGAWEIFGPAIVEFVTTMVDIIWDRIQALISFFDGLIDFIKAVFTGDWGAAWEALQQIFTAVWDLMVGYVEEAWAKVKLAVSTIIDGVKLLWDWSFLSDWVGTAVDAVWSFFFNLPARLLGTVALIFTAAKEIGKKIIDGIAEGVTGAVGFIGDFAKGLFNAVAGFINDNIIQRVNDAIPNSLGLGPFSVDLPPDPIPKIKELASGGVITQTTLALLGETSEARPEIVTPERLMRQVFAETLRDEGGGGGGGIVFAEGAIVVNLGSGSAADATNAGQIIADQVARRLDERRSATMRRLSVGVDA